MFVRISLISASHTSTLETMGSLCSLQRVCSVIQSLRASSVRAECARWQVPSLDRLCHHYLFHSISLSLCNPTLLPTVTPLSLSLWMSPFLCFHSCGLSLSTREANDHSARGVESSSPFLSHPHLSNCHRRDPSAPAFSPFHLPAQCDIDFNSKLGRECQSAARNEAIRLCPIARRHLSILTQFKHIDRCA